MVTLLLEVLKVLCAHFLSRSFWEEQYPISMFNSRNSHVGKGGLPPLPSLHSPWLESGGKPPFPT